MNCADLTTMKDFVAEDGCTLRLVAGTQNLGAKKIGSPLEFQWTLRPSQWSTVADLIEPFVDLGSPGYQWLSGAEARQGLEESEIAVLLTTEDDGRW
jgi:hypothetical protein